MTSGQIRVGPLGARIDRGPRYTLMKILLR